MASFVKKYLEVKLVDHWPISLDLASQHILFVRIKRGKLHLVEKNTDFIVRLILKRIYHNNSSSELQKCQYGVIIFSYIIKSYSLRSVYSIFFLYFSSYTTDRFLIV